MKKNLPLFFTFLCVLLLESCRKDDIEEVVYENTWPGQYHVHDTLKSPWFSGGGADTTYRDYMMTLTAFPGPPDTCLLTNMFLVGDARMLTATVDTDTITINKQFPNPHEEGDIESMPSMNGYRRNDTIFFYAVLHHPLGDVPKTAWGIAVKQ